MEVTQGKAYPANVYKAAFPKGVSLGSFNPHSQAGRIGVRVYQKSQTLKWNAGEKLAKLGTVNSADLRKPRKVRLHAALNVQWSKMDKSKDPKMIIKMSSVMEDAELQRNLGSV